MAQKKILPLKVFLKITRIIATISAITIATTSFSNAETTSFYSNEKSTNAKLVSSHRGAFVSQSSIRSNNLNRHEKTRTFSEKSLSTPSLSPHFIWSPYTIEKERAIGPLASAAGLVPAPALSSFASRPALQTTPNERKTTAAASAAFNPKKK